MGQIIIAVTVIWSFAVSLAVFWKKRLADTFCIAIGMIILTLFILSIAGIPLVISFWITNGLIFLFTILLFVAKNHCWKEYRDIVLSEDSLVLCAFIAFLFYVVRDMRAFHWDEFSHWFLRTKVMFLENNLGCGAQTALILQEYPPGSNIFEYYFARWGSEFWEPSAYYAHNFLCFSFLFPLIFKGKGKVAKVIFLLLAPLVFSIDYYNRIQVDAFLGIAFAGILLQYLLFGIEEKFYRFKMCIMLSVLVLTKETGIGLAIILFLIFATDMLIHKKSYKKLPILGIGILPVYCIWEVYLKLQGGANQYVTAGTAGVDLERAGAIMRKMGEALFATPISKLPWVGWMLFFICISVIIIYKSKSWFLPAALFLAQAIFLIGLAYTYMFNLSEYEGLNLASYPRYMSSFLIAIFVVLVYWFLFEVEYAHKFFGGGCITGIILISIFLSSPKNLWKHIIHPAQKVEDSKTQMIPVDFLRDKLLEYHLMNDETEVGLICQNTIGLQWYMCKYEIFPAQLRKCESWSLGSPYYEEDRWTVDVTLEKFIDFLKEIDYLWCYYVDEQFVEKYGSVFEKKEDIQNHSLYKVLENEDGSLNLTKMK